MITRQQVALMQLSSLGLLTPPPSEASKTDVLQTIRRMGVLQIDTISGINRSPYLVLWSRLGNYDTVWLEKTHANGELFEYWAHANCFIPIEDYPLFRRKMLERTTHWWDVSEWVKNHQEMIDFVKETIKQKGPQKSSDFPKRVGKNNGWWDWKEEKIALDLLWTKGDLMIPYRVNFQRYYDLRENIVKNHLVDLDIPELTLVNEVLVEKTIRILGATRQKWIADYYRLKQIEVRNSIQTLVDKQKILFVESEDFPEGILIHKDNLDLMDQTLKGNLKAEYTSFLSPFDPL
ncbi:MAG TPA: crosslink repair DNA glycosylase YcaQ family protein, partial [Anaerolineaceae bacterium]|nr:crosslink repair DNA glycosylase YcaQ family protein [Anaerolineaceae bacterium]